MCLRCNRVGHVRRQCRTPRCVACRRYGHTAGECVFTYADKLREGDVAANEISSEHLMDLGDVVDASGDLHLQSGASSVKPAEVVVPSQPPSVSSPGPETAESEPVPPDISPTDDPPASPEGATIIAVVKAEEMAMDPIEGGSSAPPPGSGVPVKRPASPVDPLEVPTSRSLSEDRAVDGGESKRRSSGVRLKPYAKAPTSTTRSGDALGGNSTLP